MTAVVETSRATEGTSTSRGKCWHFCTWEDDDVALCGHSLVGWSYAPANAPADMGCAECIDIAAKEDGVTPLELLEQYA